MAQTKITVGSGVRKTENWIKATINTDKIKDYIQSYEGNNFVKLNINIESEPNKYGKDVSISIDTWTPEGNVKPKQSSNDELTELDLPF